MYDQNTLKRLSKKTETIFYLGMSIALIIVSELFACIMTVIIYQYDFCCLFTPNN